MRPEFSAGDRVRLLDICGTVAEPPDVGVDFVWVRWDDGQESWAIPECLEPEETP